MARKRRSSTSGNEEDVGVWNLREAPLRDDHEPGVGPQGRNVLAHDHGPPLRAHLVERTEHPEGADHVQRRHAFVSHQSD